MSLSSRIKKLIDLYAEGNQTVFSNEIGVKQNSVSNACRGANEPKSGLPTKILIRYKQVNARWLMTGEGEMLTKEEAGTKSYQQTESENRIEEPQSVFEVRNKLAETEDEIITQIHKFAEAFTRLRAENKLLKEMLNHKNEK